MTKWGYSDVDSDSRIVSNDMNVEVVNSSEQNKMLVHTP